MKLTRIPFATVTDVQRQRFWKKVKCGKADECWPWTAATKGKGYGIVTMNKVNIGSTRIGWLIVHGADPFPLHVLHRCDNPVCHNPSHWFLGTNHENISDRNRKGRGGRKVHEQQVSEIKSALNRGESQSKIAARFGVNQTLISAIKRGIVWSHVSA